MNRSLRRWGPLIGVMCLGWCAWLLADVLPQLGWALANASPQFVVAAVLLSSLGSWLVYEAWRALASNVLAVDLPRIAGAHVYFTAQLLKYLPGRVWGFGYQALAGAALAPASAWLLTSVVHFALATLMLLYFALVIVMVHAGAAWILAAIALGIAGAAGLSMATDRLPVVTAVGRLSRGKAEALLAAWPRIAGLALRDRLTVIALLGLGTAVGFVAWIPLAAATPWPIESADALQLAAVYGLAWFAGYLAIFTPAGLGVRELVFVWLTPNFPPELIATLAVLGRLNLLFADLLLGAAFAFARAPSQ